MQGRQSLLTFLTMDTRRSRSSSNFYALIGQCSFTYRTAGTRNLVLVNSENTSGWPYR